MRRRPYVLSLALLLGLSILASSSSAQSVDVIRLNQIGFYPDMPKHAAVVGADGDAFFIVDAAGTMVHAGSLSDEQLWPHSGERVRIADFSAVTEEGSYRVMLEDGSVSHPFRVAAEVLRDAARAALRGFYYQRMSTPLPEAYAGPWARPAGHPDTSVAVHPSAAGPGRPAGTVIAAPGGWYDAGDYNKYVVNSGISTYQLMAIYEQFPEFSAELELDIPESGGVLPDVLDEALWNLRWMLAMQDPEDGGVYHKLTTASFEAAVMPHEATSQRYVVKKSTAAALNFAAVMAQAGRIFAEFEQAVPGLADSMKTAATRARQWAQSNPDMLYEQDSMNQRFDPDVVTGAYGDRDVSDEFAWAAVELYVTTGDASYLSAVDDHVGEWSVPHWGDVRALGYYTLLHHAGEAGEEARVDDVARALTAMADAIRASYEVSPYRVAMGMDGSDFVWGSNAVAMNQSMALIQAYRLTGDRGYLEAALSNADYVLGRNATGYSFLTGHGSTTPFHIHHRPSQADGIAEPVPGLLAGGPNPGQQDLEGCTADGEAYPSDHPAKSYLDAWCSYASNEIAINWNAPLAYVLVALEAVMAGSSSP